MPITVDNDVNLAALGELWFGAGQNTQDMILIAIGTGIGAGVIIDGALYRGSKEASGEIGNMLPGQRVSWEELPGFWCLGKCRLWNRELPGVLANLLKSKREPLELENLTSEDVFEAARAEAGVGLVVISETVDYLAIAIINLVAAFDPELIVLGGGVSRSADMLIEPIMRRIHGAIPNPPKLVVSNLGLQATVMGAITNVLHNTSNFYVVHKLS